MTLRLGAPRCLLVIAPHPDDETIGAFGLMLRFIRRGVSVRVLIVSDGAGSHAASPTWQGCRLVRERRRETLRAVRRIGVPAHQVTFLNLPDGGLNREAEQTHRAISAALRRSPKPALVAAPIDSDDHPDHRMVADAVAAARMAGVRTLHYPVWPVSEQLPGARRLPLTAQQRLAKRSTLRGYRTQTGRITDDPNGFAMTRRQIAAFSGPVETFVESRR